MDTSVPLQLQDEEDEEEEVEEVEEVEEEDEEDVDVELEELLEDDELLCMLNSSLSMGSAQPGSTG